jgi:hypothetical protein
MKKTTVKPKKENKQIVEIHIYTHNVPFTGGGAGNFGGYYNCTCGQRNGITSAPCPVHPLNPPYITTSLKEC